MLRARNKPWTPTDEVELVRLAATGIDRIDLARKLNRSVVAVESRAYKLGIQLPHAYQWKRGQRVRRAPRPPQD